MAMWLYGLGKHTSAVCMYISGHQDKVSDKTFTAKRIQAFLDFPFHKKTRTIIRCKNIVELFTIICLEMIYFVLYT